MDLQWKPDSASLIASCGSLAGPANIAMVTGEMTVHDLTWALRCRRVISSYANQSVGRRLTAARWASGPTSLGAGPRADALWNRTLLSRLSNTKYDNLSINYLELHDLLTMHATPECFCDVVALYWVSYTFPYSVSQVISWPPGWETAVVLICLSICPSVTRKYLRNYTVSKKT